MFVSQSEGVVLVAFSVEGTFAIATFENRTDTNRLVFRQSHVISTGSIQPECGRLTLISESAFRSEQGFFALLGLCQSPDQTSVFFTLANINLLNLTESSSPVTSFFSHVRSQIL